MSATAKTKTKAATAAPAPAPAERTAPPARETRFVHDLVQRHFGCKPKRVVAVGGGLTNRVYQFRVSERDFIVRSNADATKISDYLKEQWAMDAARAVGVPTPLVLEVGNFPDGRPYMISQNVRGIDGRDASGRVKVVEALGQLAARLHAVRTHGFGAVFDWSSNTLSRHAGWADWLASGFDAGKRLQTLVQQRMLDAAQQRELKAVGQAMARWRKPPVLHHGDLRLKNVIIDPESEKIAAVLDWENAFSSPAPFWDLSLALHDLGIDAKEAFLSGYGVKPRAFEAMRPFVRFFNVLNYAGTVGRAAARKDKERLEQLRLRLRGGLDLYA